MNGPLNWRVAAACVVGLAAAWSALPNSLAAQDSDVRVPVLGEHRFTMPGLVQDPFVRTRVSNTLGVGEAVDIDFGTIVLPGGDTLIAINGDLTFALLDFEYAHALRDWLGVWGRVSIAARLGTDVGALLSSGVTLGTAFELGWIAQVRETNKSLLSATVSVRNSSFTVVDLPNWVQDIIDGNSANLVKSTPSLRAAGGLHYAYAINDLFGVVFSGDASFGESLRERGQEWYFAGGAGVSMDLNARTDVPLGISLGLRADSYPTVNGSQTRGWQGYALTFAYNGRDDVILSLTTEGQRVPFREDDKMTVGMVSFDMRYFF